MCTCSVLVTKPSDFLVLFCTLLMCGCRDNVVLIVIPGSPGCQFVGSVGPPYNNHRSLPSGGVCSGQTQVPSGQPRYEFHDKRYCHLRTGAFVSSLLR